MYKTEKRRGREREGKEGERRRGERREKGGKKGDGQERQGEEGDWKIFYYDITPFLYKKGQNGDKWKSWEMK